MFKLKNENNLPLSLFAFARMLPNGKIEMIAEMDYTGDSVAKKMVSNGVPSMQFLGGVPIQNILEKLDMNTTAITYKIENATEAKEMSQQVFKGSLEMSIEKYKDKLTKTDIQSLKRIITKL